MRNTIWRGGRARFNAPDLKSGVGSSLPGVRIPPSPPNLESITSLCFREKLAQLTLVSRCNTIRRDGRARFNAPDLKSGVGSSLPGVRIPLSPPNLKPAVCGLFPFRLSHFYSGFHLKRCVKRSCQKSVSYQYFAFVITTLFHVPVIFHTTLPLLRYFLDAFPLFNELNL